MAISHHLQDLQRHPISTPTSNGWRDRDKLKPETITLQMRKWVHACSHCTIRNAIAVAARDGRCMYAWCDVCRVESWPVLLDAPSIRWEYWRHRPCTLPTTSTKLAVGVPVPAIVPERHNCTANELRNDDNNRCTIDADEAKRDALMTSSLNAAAGGAMPSDDVECLRLYYHPSMCNGCVD